ncbi:hypothetical protein ACOMHN_029148 [Nucella lapillus]
MHPAKHLPSSTREDDHEFVQRCGECVAPRRLEEGGGHSSDSGAYDPVCVVCERGKDEHCYRPTKLPLVDEEDVRTVIIVLVTLLPSALILALDFCIYRLLSLSRHRRPTSLKHVSFSSSHIFKVQDVAAMDEPPLIVEYIPPRPPPPQEDTMEMSSSAASEILDDFSQLESSHSVASLYSSQAPYQPGSSIKAEPYPLESSSDQTL